jgi:hypothetical protein
MTEKEPSLMYGRVTLFPSILTFILCNSDTLMPASLTVMVLESIL